VPNGADAPGIPIPLPLPAIPGPSFADVGRAIAGFFGFGGSRGPQIDIQTPAQAQARVSAFRAAQDPQQVIAARTTLGAVVERSIQTGRAPIPTPAQGGPPLVTERFEALPGPFVPEPDIPILQELGIPFPEPIPRFQPGPIPEPDVLEEAMAVDSPLLAGFGGLPAVRAIATPTVSGFLGGLAQDVLSGFLRAPQELGMAQVPGPVSRTGQAIRPFAEEKPSTRILRQIHASTGVRVKLSSAKALIRQLGLQNGARCLGISVTDACTLIITSSPRRRRGISGSDIRIVKRTARRFQALQEDLSGLVSRRRAAPRRRTQHVRTAAVTHA